MKIAQNKFQKYLRTIKVEDRIAIIHHTDTDGISSAVLLGKIIEKTRGKPIDLRINQEPHEISITKKTLENLKKEEINKIIITDLAVDQTGNHVYDLEKFAKVMIIDHHETGKKILSKKTVIIKPRMMNRVKNSDNYCAAKMAYDLGSDLYDLRKEAWIAALGIIGDNAEGDWTQFIKEVQRRNKTTLKELRNAAEIIYSIESYNPAKTEVSYQELYKSANPVEIIQSPIKKYYRLVKKEISHWEHNAKHPVEIYPQQQMVFHLIKPKYPIKSQLTKVMERSYPKHTLIIAQDMNGKELHISARSNNSKIAVNDLMEKATKRLHQAHGGGHRGSAGGTIRREDLNHFKRNILTILEQRGGQAKT